MENLIYILFTFGYFLVFGIFGIKCIRLFYIPSTHLAYYLSVPIIYAYIVYRVMDFMPRKIENIRAKNINIRAEEEKPQTDKDKSLNMSFQTWLNTLRIEESKVLLTSGEKLSIEEVGTRVGIPQSYNFSSQSNMNKLIKAASIVVIALLSGCIKERQNSTELKIGDNLPSFSITMNDGSVVSDASLKGRISLIMFFHTTCPDCQRTLPHMQKLYEEYKDNESVCFTLISREQKDEEINEYWGANALSLPYSAQDTRDIYNLFASDRIPRVYISDSKGIIQHIYTDDPTPTYEDLKIILEECLHSDKL